VFSRYLKISFHLLLVYRKVSKGTNGSDFLLMLEFYISDSQVQPARHAIGRALYYSFHSPKNWSCHSRNRWVPLSSPLVTW